jgi:ABC-type sugar transport system substrate-binding protein
LANSIIGSIIPNNDQAGYEMAKSLIRLDENLHGPRNDLRMLALTGDDSTPAALERQKGMERAVAETRAVDLLGAIPVNWNGETAYQRTKEFLDRTRIDVVWGANDDIALGATRAAMELGLKPGKDIVFAGLNWSKAGMEAVRRGELTMTHGGHFFAGAWVMVMLYDFHFRTDQDVTGNDVVFEMSAITSGNVNVFLDRLGDEDWGKIDFRHFSRVITGRSNYDFSTQAILDAAGNSAR